MPQISQQSLRIEIDGTWMASEFATAFRSLNDLYSIRAVLQFEREALFEFEDLAWDFPHPPPSVRRIASLMRRRLAGAAFPYGLPPVIDVQKPRAAFDLLEPNERLFVRRIRFESPGFKDLVGLGEIVGHLKDFMLRLIQMFLERPQRRLENAGRRLDNERRELENEGKRIENAKSFVELARTCGYTKADVRKLVSWVDGRQALLVPLIDSGKITNVQLLSEDQEKSG
jgi:hypothetical protein